MSELNFLDTGGNKLSIATPTANTMSFKTQNIERVRIDSSGRVLIGTTTEGVSNADDLTVATSGDTGITIRSGSSASGRIFFSDATSGNGEYTGGFEYNHNDDSMRFFTNGGTERLRINSNGILTKPNQPSFHAVRTAGDVSGNNYVVFNRVDHNNGGHYNSSNGRFTAPVTGVYFFSVYHYTGGTPHSAISFRINGSQFGAYHWDDTGGCATWVAPMTAGQYAQIYTVSYTFRGSPDYHNGFNGFLIG